MALVGLASCSPSLSARGLALKACTAATNSGPGDKNVVPSARRQDLANAVGHARDAAEKDRQWQRLADDLLAIDNFERVHNYAPLPYYDIPGNVDLTSLCSSAGQRP